MAVARRSVSRAEREYDAEGNNLRRALAALRDKRRAIGEVGAGERAPVRAVSTKDGDFYHVRIEAL